MDQPQSKSWWGRNWKWFVHIGGLSSLALLLGFVALIINIVFGKTRSSDAYRQALSKVRSTLAIVTTIGSPIQDGYITSGSLNEDEASGNADLTIPISGPKGKATLYLKATKSAGAWSYSKLVVQLDQTGERINLLNGIK